VKVVEVYGQSPVSDVDPSIMRAGDSIENWPAIVADGITVRQAGPCALNAAPKRALGGNLRGIGRDLERADPSRSRCACQAA